MISRGAGLSRSERWAVPPLALPGDLRRREHFQAATQNHNQAVHVVPRPHLIHAMKPTQKTSARAADRPTTSISQSTGTKEQRSSEKAKQDRVTLIAFYALFAAIVVGLLYFISLLFFI